MRLDFVLALGLLAVLLVLRAISRRTVAGRMQTLMTDRTDPAGSKQQLEELMAEEGAKEAVRRARLWEEATSSLRAARKLQRAIEEDRKANEDIRRYVAERRPDDKEGMLDLKLRRKEIEQELERVAGLIRHLRT